ncbi:MAG TPA: helix-turn-helix domain-containing protein, partial [Ktedonobacteraceae bacterium]|nr:helix-turn-helix domain-containing protein [Ktedonobacteraceae bacterium]
GRGRKPTYTSEQRARILQEVQRTPDRKADQTATWSLMLLRDTLRKTGLPQIAAETIREIYREYTASLQNVQSQKRGKTLTEREQHYHIPQFNSRDSANGDQLSEAASLYATRTR